MKLTGAIAGLLVMIAAVGCAVVIEPGNAALPPGIEEARLPNVEIGGFLYYSSSPPLTLGTSHLIREFTGGVASALAPADDITLARAALVVSPAFADFGGLLTFESENGALQAQGLLDAYTAEGIIWSEPALEQVMIASLTTEWGRLTQQALQGGDTLRIAEHSPEVWDLLTNLPARPPAAPVATGALRLDPAMVESIGQRAGLLFSDVGAAFGFVSVDSMAFGVYADEPVNVSVVIDEKYLSESGASVLFVSQSAYPSGLVAFMLSVIGDKTEMEIIELGATNARYRQLGALHLILKNKGSLIYAAVAGSRQDAETLILSALES